MHSISRQDVDAIVDTVSGLASIAQSVEVPLDEFAEDVAEAIAEGKHSITYAAASDRERFKSRVRDLLDNRSVLVAAKARLVFIEHEHYLCYARIMTDIRPVFGQDVEAKPMAAMVAHTLKLVYTAAT